MALNDSLFTMMDMTAAQLLVTAVRTSVLESVALLICFGTGNPP